MWMPEHFDAEQPLYRAIAARLREDVGAGRLSPGDRLPTVRHLADALGINVGTVYRAYTLAEQQGIVSKEPGRGTFVRDIRRDSGPARSGNPEGGAILQGEEDSDHDPTGPVDMTRNEPPFVPLDGMLRQSLIEISRNSPLDGMLEYGHSQGLARHREILAEWLIRTQGLEFDATNLAESLIVTGGAQQGLTIALGALANPGDTILVEELSYPGVRNLARFFGLLLRPVAMDDQGIVPEALDRACTESGARVLYCMPHAHNPTTATMDEPRRLAVATIAERHGLMVIEDDVNPHSISDVTVQNPAEKVEIWRPLATVLPDRTLYISGLSKIIAPGLRVGMIAAPAGVFSDVLAASQTTSWMAPPLMAELACLWIRNGMARDLMEHRATITADLQAVARRVLAELPYRAHPANTHLWLPLPTSWSAREFVDAASGRGVMLSPSTQFAIDPSNVQPGVRLCLSDEGGRVAHERLERALATITELYFEPPRPQAFRM